MIIDAHAHIGTAAYQSVDTYLKALDKAGIERGIVFPGGTMDVRKMTSYVTGELKAGPEIPNEVVFKALKDHPDRLSGFVMVNPLAPDALEVFDRGVEAGCAGLKLNPLAHRFSFASKVVDLLADRCAALGMPVYAHSLFDPGSSSRKFAALAERHPGGNFILGHLGFGPCDTQAFGLAATLPNLYLETSLGCLLAMEEALKTAGQAKLIFGSEFPMSSPDIELHKLKELCTSSPDAWQAVSGGNLRRLIPSLSTERQAVHA